MEMNIYIPRLADRILERKLKGKGAVLIQGPKWCGKTTTAEQIAGSVIYMDEPAQRRQNVRMADISPTTLLEAAPSVSDTKNPPRRCAWAGNLYRSCFCLLRWAIS